MSVITDAMTFISEIGSIVRYCMVNYYLSTFFSIILAVLIVLSILRAVRFKENGQ